MYVYIYMLWDIVIVRADNHIGRAILSTQKPKCTSPDIWYGCSEIVVKR